MNQTPKTLRPTFLASAALACLLALPALPASAGSRSSFSFGISIGSGHRSHSRYSSHYSHSSHYSRSSRYPSYHSSRVYHRPVVVRPPVYCPPPVVYHTPVVYHRPFPTSVVVVSPRTVYTPPPATTTTYTYSAPEPTPVVYQPAPAPAVYSPPAPAPAPALPTGPVVQQAYLDGWALLRADQSRKSLNAFAAEAEQYPQRGLPKIGYALASAMNNDDTKAAWAMRHAINTDPASLASLSQDDSTHRRIDSLIARYTQRINEGFTRSDDRFIVAALYTLKLDYANAKQAVDEALAHGDNDTATSGLQRLIAQHLPQ